MAHWTDGADGGVAGAAHHEAGHAVAGWRRGLTISSLELTEGFWSGRVTSGFTEVAVPFGASPWGAGELTGADASEDEVTGMAVFLLAGGAAHARWLMVEGGMSEGEAERTAETGTGGDRDYLRQLLAHAQVELSVPFLEQQAAREVEAHWPRITEAADRLASAPVGFGGRRRVRGAVAR